MTDATPTLSSKEYLKQNAPSEHDLQAALVRWCKAKGAPYRLIYANVNGQYRPGQRKEPGMRKGIPDLFLPHPLNGKAGLYIELKTPTGRLREEQREWLQVLRGQGYAARVCYGLDEAQKTITNYVEDENE